MRTLFTVRNYDLYEVVSALQKAIRRNDPRTAGYFAIEMFESGYSTYCWKRLLTISAEDCAGIITKEIKTLYDSFELINKGKTGKDKRGRIFISKAVLILCQAEKSRDADHLQNFVYDHKIGMPDQEIEIYLNKVRSEMQDIPNYTYDVHTKRGKMSGKTKKDFFRDEFNALEPRQLGLFDQDLSVYLNKK